MTRTRAGAHALLTLAVAAASLLACAAAPRADLPRLTLVPFVRGLERPVDLETAPGDPRLFVVEQWGRIRVIENGRLRARPFLDITDRTSRGNEQGLLGIAFHPQFATNGLLFVNYTDRDGNTNVVRYRVTPDRAQADPATATRILHVDQPYSNHNGGQLVFGPDGMLWIPLGDGGLAGDPHGNAQNRNVLLGKLLRIDVDHGAPYAIPSDNPYARGGGRPEVWAYGLRNPWRIAFDGDLLYIGDVGQDTYEEVDVAAWREPGIDYGWKLREGLHPFRPDAPSAGGTPHDPVVEYPHREGCCVIGGRVYRGPVAALRGLYFYADECTGWIAAFRARGGRATESVRWRPTASIEPTSFGEDAQHELYVLDLKGTVYRIGAPAP